MVRSPSKKKYKITLALSVRQNNSVINWDQQVFERASYN